MSNVLSRQITVTRTAGYIKNRLQEALQIVQCAHVRPIQMVEVLDFSVRGTKKPRTEGSPASSAVTVSGHSVLKGFSLPNRFWADLHLSDVSDIGCPVKIDLNCTHYVQVEHLGEYRARWAYSGECEVQSIRENPVTVFWHSSHDFTPIVGLSLRQSTKDAFCRSGLHYIEDVRRCTEQELRNQCQNADAVTEVLRYIRWLGLVCKVAA